MICILCCGIWEIMHWVETHGRASLRVVSHNSSNLYVGYVGINYDIII